MVVLSTLNVPEVVAKDTAVATSFIATAQMLGPRRKCSRIVLGKWRLEIGERVSLNCARVPWNSCNQLQCCSDWSDTTMECSHHSVERATLIPSCN